MYFGAGRYRIWIGTNNSPCRMDNVCGRIGQMRTRNDKVVKTKKWILEKGKKKNYQSKGMEVRERGMQSFYKDPVANPTTRFRSVGGAIVAKGKIARRYLLSFRKGCG
ncbi:hypothetical protein TWF694_009643 [Orbilia ellipsospora]|uniref:Uncharacterized protein n=1 Tax=Orbilia ellipsospora TaxID=2528407 RepID=A0AAV9XHV2_9PEZI